MLDVEGSLPSHFASTKKGISLDVNGGRGYYCSEEKAMGVNKSIEIVKNSRDRDYSNRIEWFNNTANSICIILV